MVAPAIGLAQTDRSYSGVSTEFPDPATGAEALTDAPGHVRWIGFEPKEGSSRLFVQLTSVVEPEMSRSGEVVTVRLPGLRLATRNMRRPIIPRFFATPVRWVRAKRSSGGVVVQVRLKGPAEAKLTTRDQGAYRYVILEFPPGQPDENGGSAKEKPTVRL